MGMSDWMLDGTGEWKLTTEMIGETNKVFPNQNFGNFLIELNVREEAGAVTKGRDDL